MTECNHHSCTSRFCPTCGEALGSAPLDDLRRHCVRNRDKALKAVKRIEDRMDGSEQGRAWGIKCQLRYADRWGSYVLALDELHEKIAMLTRGQHV